MVAEAFITKYWEGLGDLKDLKCSNYEIMWLLY